MCSWPDGDLVGSARLKGAFEVGSTIISQLRDLPETESIITLVERPHMWINESRMVDLTMTFQHLIEEVSGGCRLTERAVARGPLAAEVLPYLEAQLPGLFAETTALVARRATLASTTSEREG